MNLPLHNIVKKINEEIEIQFDEPIDSKEQLLAAIAQRVAYFLDKQPELLLSYLYRLDVSEERVRQALLGENENVIAEISNLILERQLQRVKTKINLKQDSIEGWDW